MLCHSVSFKVGQLDPRSPQLGPGLSGGFIASLDLGLTKLLAVELGTLWEDWLLPCSPFHLRHVRISGSSNIEPRTLDLHLSVPFL